MALVRWQIVTLAIGGPAEIATGKPFAPAMTCDIPVISMDLSATVLDAAHVKPGEGTAPDGLSLRPVFQGKKPDRDALFFHYPHYAFHKANRPGGAIRAGQHKLIRRYDDNSLELFDLVADVGEKRNLAAEKPELAAMLDAKLGHWLRDTTAQMPTRVR